MQKLNPPVHQEDSPYQQVRVRDDQLFRYLVLDRTFHAVMWKTDPLPLFLPYSQLMVASLAIVEEPRRGLILGHGGGSLAKWLAHFWPGKRRRLLDAVKARCAQTIPNCLPDEFPYADEIKTNLMMSLLQARTVLGWFRHLQAAGVSPDRNTLDRQ